MLLPNHHNHTHFCQGSLIFDLIFFACWSHRWSHGLHLWLLALLLRGGADCLKKRVQDACPCDAHFLRRSIQLAHWRVVAQTEDLCLLVRWNRDLDPCPFRCFCTSASAAAKECNQKIMAVQRLCWRLPCAACLFHDLDKIRFLARATLLCGVWE